MKLSLILAGTTGFATTMLVGLAAEAQESYFERDRYTSVTEREQSEFNPEPVRAGAWEMSPELELGVGTRSNLFATSTNEVDDVVVVAAPKLRGRTSWSRHELNFDANVRHSEFLDNGSESRTDYGASLGGRADASSALNFTASVRAGKNSESRGVAASVANASEPVEVDRVGGKVGANYQAGRIQLSASAALDQFDYQDVSLNSGAVLDQDFRDRDQSDIRARASWAVNRDMAVFVEAGQIDRSYDAPTVLNPLNRDSQGTIVRVGANFELPVLLRGDISVGHQSFDFDDASLAEVEGLSLDASLQWFVTQLMTFSLSGSRSVEDPGLLNTAGAEVTSWTARGDFEARRNLLLFAEANFANFDYENINRSDDRVIARIGATYKLNKRAWVETSFRHTNQDSNFQDFSDNRLQVALKLYP